MKILIRIIGILWLLFIAGFCVFGFLATYEYPELDKRLPWQIGYTVLGLACLGAVNILLRSLRRR